MFSQLKIWGLKKNANGHREDSLRKRLRGNLTVRETRRNEMTYILLERT